MQFSTPSLNVENVTCTTFFRYPTRLHGSIRVRSTKVTEIAHRKHQPDSLYLLVADLPSKHDDSTQDILAPRRFIWSDITRAQIESHLAPRPMLVHTSPFLSAHVHPSRALEFLPLDYRKRISPTATNILKINARALVAAWAYTQNDDKMPVWIEQGRLPQLPTGVLSMTTTGFDDFESSCWICIDEVRELLDIGDDVCVGQWLACGKVPARMICTRDGVHASEEELEVRSETASRSTVVHKKLHTISKKKVLLRTSSLSLGAVKEETGDVRRKHTTKRRPPTGVEEQGEVHEPTKHQEATKTQQVTDVDQNKRIQHSKPPPLPPRSPHRPHRPHGPHWIPPFMENSRHTSINIPAPLLPRRSTIESQNNLPDSIAVRDFAPLPTITLTPPTPQPTPLLYSTIAITSQGSNHSAATLARLEDVALRGAALNMWMEEIRKKQQDYREAEARKATEARKEIKTDIWTGNWMYVKRRTCEGGHELSVCECTD
jgi:hypothetical protein